MPWPHMAVTEGAGPAHQQLGLAGFARQRMGRVRMLACGPAQGERRTCGPLGRAEGEGGAAPT
jgi:hypothetical protein